MASRSRSPFGGDDLRPQQVRATLDGEYVWVPEFGGTARLADIDASGGIVDIDIVHVGGPSRVLPGTYLGVVLSELEPGDLVSFGLAYGAPGTDTGAVVWLVPAPEPVPEGTETGIPEVDSVIALFLAGDVEAIESRLIYTEAKCVEEPEIGRTVVCADDEEPGTLVLAFPGVLGCHGGMVRHDEEVRSQAPVGGELYGVGVVGGAEWSGAEYVIVMTGGRFVLVNSDGIVGWGGDCGPSSYYLDGIASRVILHGPGYSR